MLEFLGFGRSKNEVHDNTDTIPATRPMPGEYPTPTQREMVRLTLHTLLKRHGIPATWLSAEMGAFPTGFDPEAILIQLVIQHWHPGFGLYAPALQSELMDGLKRFDPAANATRYHIHWKFAAESGCPHNALPDSSYWTSPAPVAAAVLQMQAMPAHKPKFDLPDPDDDDDSDNGFAATQMHDIR
jgi:hypothetical protein